MENNIVINTTYFNADPFITTAVISSNYDLDCHSALPCSNIKKCSELLCDGNSNGNGDGNANGDGDGDNVTFRLKSGVVSLKDLANTISELNNKIKELEDTITEMKYAPRGVGYFKAKEHFESISSRN